MKPYCVLAPTLEASVFICGDNPYDAAHRAGLKDLPRGSVVEVLPEDSFHTHGSHDKCITVWVRHRSSLMRDVRNIIARATLAGLEIVHI